MYSKIKPDVLTLARSFFFSFFHRACMHDTTSSHETKDLSHYSSPKEQKAVALSRYELAGPSHVSKSMDLGEVNAASGDEETMIDNSSQPLFSE